jgi:hypothetical protein
MKMTQTTSKYPKYDDNVPEGMKSTETKRVLKANTKQTCYGKTKPDSRNSNLTSFFIRTPVNRI